MSESYIQSKILRYLKTTYPQAFIVKLSDRWVGGLPDIMMIHNGSIYFFEVKTEKSNPTKIQMYTMMRISEAGGFCSVVRSVKETEGRCQQWMKDS